MGIYQNPAAGGDAAFSAMYPAIPAGETWNPYDVQMATHSNTPDITRTYLLPVRIDRVQAWRGSVFRISAGAGNVKLGWYAHAAGKATGNPLAEIASTAVAAATVYEADFSSGDWTPDIGLYWLAVQVSDATIRLMALTASFPYTPRLVGASAANGMGAAVGAAVRYVTGTTYGTLPDLTGHSFTEESVYRAGIAALRAR